MDYSLVGRRGTRFEVMLTLWHQLLPYGYSYNASRARPG